jgi:AcrR family transcriptional regulator
VAAARELLTIEGAPLPSVGEVAARAGVSRLSVYHHFGSKAGLFEAVASEARSAGRPQGGDPDSAAPLELLRRRIEAGCDRWSRDPALFRRLPAAAAGEPPDSSRALAERLAAADGLRPGCSLKEAEDVIALVTSFDAFDRLYGNGRRTTAAVTEILLRMAAGILAAA